MWRPVLFALCALQAWGAAYTSVKSGAWSDQTVWSPAGVPGNGDTVSIANGHTVTVDQDTTVGTSVNAYYSYVHSIAVTPGEGYTTCSSAVFTGGTPHFANQGLWDGTSGNACRVVSGGLHTQLIVPLAWYSVASAAPTASIAGSTGAGASVAVAWAQGSGVAAIALNATGRVAIGEDRTLRARGTIVYTTSSANTTSGVTFGPGSSLIFDSSQAQDIAGCTETPGSATCKPIYSYGPSGSTNYGYRTFMADCSDSARRCTLTSDTGGRGGSISGHSFTNSQAVTLKYVDVSNMGDAVTGYIQGGSSTGPSSEIVVDRCTITNSGPLYSGTIANDVDFTFTANTVTSTVARAALEVVFGAVTAGVRSISRNLFTGQVFPCVGTGAKNARGVIVEDNYFSAAPCFTNTPTTPWASFARNFLRTQISAASQTQAAFGDVKDTYWFYDGDAVNWHVTAHARDGDSSISGNIFGMGGAPSGDSGEVAGLTTQSCTSPCIYSMKDNITLPAANGYSWSELFASTTASAPNISVIIDHNTWYGGFREGGFGMIQLNETNRNPTGLYGSIQSNISFNPNVEGYLNYSFFKLRTIFTSGLHADVSSPATTDYNWGWNHSPTAACADCENQGNGYVAKYSVTPGAHDGSGDPEFVDWQRAVELFDSKYLGHSTTSHPEGETWSDWSAEGTYSPGDFVTSSDAAVYWGLPVNYRCVAAGGCTGAVKPGAPETAWRNEWEWASLYRLRQHLGAAYTVFPPDGALWSAAPSTCREENNSILCVMMAWVRKGYAPRNCLLYRSGHDGADIGAVSTTKPYFQSPVEF